MNRMTNSIKLYVVKIGADKVYSLSLEFPYQAKKDGTRFQKAADVVLKWSTQYSSIPLFQHSRIIKHIYTKITFNYYEL
jgi:hypothetical protein